jgi:hypothetical protein
MYINYTYNATKLIVCAYSDSEGKQNYFYTNQLNDDVLWLSATQHSGVQ